MELWVKDDPIRRVQPFPPMHRIRALEQIARILRSHPSSGGIDLLEKRIILGEEELDLRVFLEELRAQVQANREDSGFFHDYCLLIKALRDPQGGREGIAEEFQEFLDVHFFRATWEFGDQGKASVTLLGPLLDLLGLVLLNRDFGLIRGFLRRIARFTQDPVNLELWARVAIPVIVYLCNLDEEGMGTREAVTYLHEPTMRPGEAHMIQYLLMQHLLQPTLLLNSGAIPELLKLFLGLGAKTRQTERTALIDPILLIIKLGNTGTLTTALSFPVRPTYWSVQFHRNYFHGGSACVRLFLSTLLNLFGTHPGDHVHHLDGSAIISLSQPWDSVYVPKGGLLGKELGHFTRITNPRTGLLEYLNFPAPGKNFLVFAAASLHSDHHLVLREDRKVGNVARFFLIVQNLPLEMICEVAARVTSGPNPNLQDESQIFTALHHWSEWHEQALLYLLYL